MKKKFVDPEIMIMNYDIKEDIMNGESWGDDEIPWDDEF